MKHCYAAIAAIAVTALVTAGVAGQIQRSTRTTEATREIAATLLKPPLVPPAVGRTQAATVVVDLETTEEKGVLASGVEYTFWTFGGAVPSKFPHPRERQVESS